MSDLDELRRLMPPPQDPVENEGSWDAVERQIGCKLPRDYKLFIETYGSGTFSEMYVAISSPFSSPESGNLIVTAESTNNAFRQLVDGGYEMSFKLYPETGGLLPFATTANGDNFSWLTGGDSDKWPIVFWKCGSVEFRTFEGKGLIQLLVGLITGQFKGLNPLFSDPTPTFQALRSD